jgi:hypothetical protein
MTNDFHKTLIGQKFYNVDLPELIKTLSKLTEAVEYKNELTEKMLLLEKKKFKQINESKLNHL